MVSPGELAAHFEYLTGLPAGERAAALAALPLDAASRERLARMLRADAQDDGLLAQVIGAGAQRAEGVAGRRVGPYRLLGELGAGGMGTVLLAERADGQFTRQVAIKLLRGFPTRNAIARLRRERQILAALDHPNIARLLDGGETADGQPWLAMEYVEGRPLLEHVAHHAATLRERLQLFATMLDAVAHAHRHLIVHRDLKPANVLVTDDGTVKLLDFGIARLAEGSHDADPQASTRVFSPGYASPEQERGGTITTASDIYSLGVLLGEMLGDVPTHARPDLVRPAPLPRDAELAGMLAMATDPDPARRYQTAAEFREDVLRYLDDRPLRAARWTRGYRLRKFVRRHRPGVALGCLAAMLLAGFVWELDRETARALAAEAAAEQARARAAEDAAQARASLDFLRDVIAASAPDAALAREVSVRELLDAARGQLVKRNDPRLVKPMERLLGSLYQQLGEVRIALDLMRGGLADAVPRDREDALRLAAEFDTYSNLLGADGQVAEALAAAQRGGALREEYFPDSPLERASSLGTLANAQHRAGNDKEAIRLLRQALAIVEVAPDAAPEEIANPAQMLANLLAAGGEPMAALEILDRTLARVAERGLDGSTVQIMLLRAKANALLGAGDAAQAESLLRQAIGLQEKLVGTSGSRMMLLSNDLAVVLNVLGRYREATSLLQSSDRYLQAAGIDNPTERAITLNNRASVLESAGDYAAALLQFDQALALLDRNGVPETAEVHRRLETNRARSLGLAGRTSQAREILEALQRQAAGEEGNPGDQAMLAWQLASLARLEHDPARGLRLLAEATAGLRELVPAEHPIFLHAHRLRGAFALQQEEVARAAGEFEAALEGFLAADGPAVDLAIVRSELAAVRVREGRRDEARALLRQALPVLRESLLPGQVDRAPAETLARELGLGAPGSARSPRPMQD